MLVPEAIRPLTPARVSFTYTLMLFLVGGLGCERKQKAQKPPAAVAASPSDDSENAKLERTLAFLKQSAEDTKLPIELRDEHRQAVEALRREGWGWVKKQPRVISAAILNNGFVKIDHMHTLILFGGDIAPTKVRLLRKTADGSFIELATTSTEKAVRLGVGDGWGLQDMQIGIPVAAFHVKPEFDTTGMMEEKIDERTIDILPLKAEVKNRHNIYVEVQFANGVTAPPHHVRIPPIPPLTRTKVQ